MQTWIGEGRLLVSPPHLFISLSLNPKLHQSSVFSSRLSSTFCFLRRASAKRGRRDGDCAMPLTALLCHRVHITAALNEYKAIVKLAESKKMAFKGKEFSFAEELKICKEMVALLPSKIERLHMLDAGKSGTA
jgi:hypothetical protein